MTPLDKSFLQHLAQFKFLTRKQFFRLGVSAHHSTLSRHLTALVRAEYIGCIDATAYGLAHIYYLIEKGATVTSNQQGISLDDIHFCSTEVNLATQTIVHRTLAIGCHIEVALTSQKDDAPILLFYDRDIETIGSIKHNRELVRKTRISTQHKSLEPDAIFMLATPSGNKLYCMEVEHRDYTKRSFQKLTLHVEALNLRSPSQKYGHDKAHRVLFIYSNQATMESVMQQAQEQIEGASRWFLFKTVDEVLPVITRSKSRFVLEKEYDFREGWQTVDQQRVALY